ncbi:MAG TPA: PhoX family phosphatase [Gammaproteobacteria bacterium]|nr:PhoX family phosphatase [Gammaproteobacteria bacterium]
MNSADTLRSLLERRLTRRAALGRASRLAALSLVAGDAWCDEPRAGALTFERIAGSKDDRVTVPRGYRAEPLLRWGDPLVPGASALAVERVADGLLLDAGAPAAQARQFGYNCDGIGLFELDARRVLICVNHEYPSPELLFPGWDEARAAGKLAEFVRAHPSIVAYMQAAVGLSVVELERGSAWRYRVDSPYNRRLTASTPIELAGPARDHALLNPKRERLPIVLGTFGNCAAGTTPWGTYLTAEENVDEYFGNGGAATLDGALADAHRRFGLRARDSVYRWEHADARFDVAKNPAELLRFGWIVEVDPREPSRLPKKRTALGRMKHESATTTLAGDGRAVVYMGDDQQFEYLYKFVSAGRFDPERRDASGDLLDRGTLHVARFFDDGRGEWVPLKFREHAELTPERGFASQGDVVLRCRDAADRVGATALDRTEDIAVNPRTHNVYVSCTQNLDRDRGSIVVAGRQLDTRTDAVNPRAPNVAGHILEIAEAGGDAAATAFRWEVFLLAGDPAGGRLLTALPPAHDRSLAAEVAYFGGAARSDELSAFANPDNLGFDAAGNLWIVTDGTQPGANNNGCFVCPTEGPERGAVRQFMSGPIGAEICGCELSADGRALFLTVQHPGSGGTAAAPISRWPDGGAAAPRPSLVVIEHAAGDVVGS